MSGESGYGEHGEWMQSWEPEADRLNDYEWVVEYARLVYSRIDDTFRTLDAKAETLIRFVGSGAGLLTVGAILNIGKLAIPVIVLLILAVASALTSLVFAGLVRIPQAAKSPPTIRDAIQYVEHFWEQGSRTMPESNQQNQGQGSGSNSPPASQDDPRTTVEPQSTNRGDDPRQTVQPQSLFESEDRRER